MGSALVKSLLSQGLVTADDLTVTDPDVKKLATWKKIGVNTSTDNDVAIATDVLILAVKPQSFPDLAKTLAGRLKENVIVLSIMAGINVKKIQQLLKHKKIARAMPNTPALVGAGVTGWFAGKELDKEEKKHIQDMLQSTGYAFPVGDESQLDDVTAVYACGTGFFYFLFEEWVKASKKFDLPAKDISPILAKTLQGTLRLLESSGETPLELLAKVASKGGATEAGLKILEKAQLKKIFAKTMKAAYDRCKQMAK